MTILMRTERRALLTWGFCCLLGFCAATGCGSKGLKGLVPCEGVVTLDGAPIEGVKILLQPAESGGNMRAAVATSDVEGKFTTTTLNPNDGIFPGKYLVSITKYSYVGGSPEVAVEDESDGTSAVVEQQNELPAQYENPNQSGLTLEVPAKGVKDAQFSLTR